MTARMDVHALKATIIRFEGRFAVLETDEGVTIRWPIKQLPDDVQEGEWVRLTVSSDKTEEETHQQLAREVINSLLSS
jgi:hypothetical protein